MRWKTGPVQQLLLLEAPPSPLSSRPEESWAFGPPKAMKSGSCSATTVAGSANLPFVISTGAPRGRRGGISGFPFPWPLLWTATPLPFVISPGGVMTQRPTQGDEKRVLFSNYCCWKRQPPLCHLDRSAAQWRDLRCQRSFPGNVFRQSACPERSRMGTCDYGPLKQR